MPVQIRKAIIDDFSAIAPIARESQELHAQAHPTIFANDTPGFSEDYLRQLVENEQSDAFVAEENGHVVGYAFLHVQLLSYLDIFQPQTSTTNKVSFVYKNCAPGLTGKVGRRSLWERRPT